MNQYTINIKYPEWTAATEFGYTPITTFWQDFSIADAFGASAVKDTFNRAFAEWKNDYKYLTELVMVLNHKSWQHYEKNPQLSELYVTLFRKADGYAVNNLRGDELTYFYRVTD